MIHLILHQTQATQQYGSSWVTDQTDQIFYFLRGQLHKYYYQLQINDNKNMFLAEIKQASTGIIPRFKIQAGQKKIGSFGLALPMHEIIYIQRINWIVLAHPKKREYFIFHGKKLLLHGYLNNKKQLQMDIHQTSDQALLVLLTAFLDRYQQTILPLSLPQKFKLNYHQRSFNPAFNPQFKNNYQTKIRRR
ncbi:hypothetical protein [Weissella koreensis]|uniref:Uncharacterized protein n=1 Tax=Weissella koreensis TaxID=165096 RepID=A0A7H1MKY0_9LACO|nr:hypothetical protein [Weissella koreensis]AVH74913.1 hypothetical protein C4597_02290 [Weissella koreensis]EJF33874.1 hypothetical protein JC2156_06880 [Weissella koreensis KCTC 3621]QGN20137.1 hypothetical protein GKC51_02265 [Weissella koreensis]QNT64116.1 hypothetical protein FY536_01990 [Weissella koreensis]